MEIPATADAKVFARHRPLLFAVAYRMLGSVMDAEDIVQEALLRWQQDARTEVASPKSYLTTVVTRPCIDHLRSARVQREDYIGLWLPEPLVAEQGAEDTGASGLADSLSLAFLVLLESLSPLERAVFLLHDVFAYSDDEIAPIVGKSGAYCRQLAVRVRTLPCAAGAPDPTIRRGAPAASICRVDTCSTGDMQGWLALLAEDVTLWSDGGGKVHAALRPIFGADRVARFLHAILAKAPQGFAVHIAQVNGEPGLVAAIEGQVIGVATLQFDGERIAAIRFVVNPDKLHGLAASSLPTVQGHQL